MKIKTSILFIISLFPVLLHSAGSYSQHSSSMTPNMAGKPTPDQALDMLKNGNRRFFTKTVQHPNTDGVRLLQAGTENQGEHAFATVLACSDSRVPVERIFDAGIMDIFTVRVAGNVMNVSETGTIEYGIAHVKTPVVVVLGHTQCGAVTAVTNSVEGNGGQLERNIPALVEPIIPAVLRAKRKAPSLNGKDITPIAIEENVYQSIATLFLKSPITRMMMNEGKIKVVGAIYNVSDGKITWLDDKRVYTALQKAEVSPYAAKSPMANP